MGQLENQSVTRPVLKFLNSLPHCKAVKVHGSVYSERGTPDIIGCWHGKALVLECKSDTGEPEPDQLVRIEEWRRAGAITGVVRSIQEVKDLLLE